MRCLSCSFLVSYTNQLVAGSCIVNSWQHLSKLLNVWVLTLKTSWFLVSHAETFDQLLGVNRLGCQPPANPQ